MHLFASTDVHLIVPSQDGLLFATIQANRQILCIWDAITGEHRQTLLPPPMAFQAFISLAWSPDRCSVVAGTTLGQICVWDVSTQKVVSISYEHYGAVNSVSWSSNGALIASASRDGSIHIGTVSPKERGLPLCWLNNEVFEVIWSPDGTLIASCWQDGRVRIWNTRTGRCIFTYRGHTSAVRSCAWSPDGTRIASAGEDDTVQVWWVPIGKHWWRAFLGNWSLRLFHLLPRPSCDGSVKIVRWSPKSSEIAAMSDEGLCIWNATDTTRLACFPCRSLRSFSWFREGTRLLVAHDHRCQSWQWQEALT